MPELPEVETVRRGLEPVLLNKRIGKVIINRADLRAPVPKNFAKMLEGKHVASVVRRGKYILVFCDDGNGFVLHLGMSGRIAIYAPQEKYDPEKHDHAVFETENGTKIAFNDPRRFGLLYLVNVKTWEKESPFGMMGPEPLGNSFSGEALAKKIKNKRAPIKVALLDQNVVAGVGNIYACEALYESGIDPRREARLVTGKQAEDLAAAIKNVLRKAIKAGGSSLRDYAQTDGSPGYFQTQHGVYDREGLACKHCARANVKSIIKRIVQGGRSTFYCPRHQK